MVNMEYNKDKKEIILNKEELLNFTIKLNVRGKMKFLE